MAYLFTRSDEFSESGGNLARGIALGLSFDLPVFLVKVMGGVIMGGLFGRVGGKYLQKRLRVRYPALRPVQSHE